MKRFQTGKWIFSRKVILQLQIIMWLIHFSAMLILKASAQEDETEGVLNCQLRIYLTVIVPVQDS